MFIKHYRLSGKPAFDAITNGDVSLSIIFSVLSQSGGHQIEKLHLVKEGNHHKSKNHELCE